ncbi:class I SAM-dependent methyltransferase [Sinorhizobium meliloti]|uniref:class I SAM-dependent methyltransferase n=1 Tax=Rhizobium meliloti TaxID=382 RepID=UPI00398CF63F
MAGFTIPFFSAARYLSRNVSLFMPSASAAFCLLPPLALNATTASRNSSSLRAMITSFVGERKSVDLAAKGCRGFRLRIVVLRFSRGRITAMPVANLPLHIAAKYSLDHRRFIARNPKLAEPTAYCPCCGSSFKEWRPVFGRGRKAECHVCHSFERHRHIWLTIDADRDFFSKGSKLLHFAPEPFFKNVFGQNPNLDYFDCDLAKERATYQVDITAIPFGDEKFDRVICSHVLEHVPDDRKGMSEMFRVLKPGGIAYVMVPSEVRAATYEDPAINTPELRLKHYGQATHVRIYSRDDFVARLQECGFVVEVQFPRRKYGEEMCKDFLLGDNIYICSKPDY